MGILSIREFNANVSRALARVEAGETLAIKKNGRIFAEIRPSRGRKLDDPAFAAAFEKLTRGMDIGVPGLRGPASYDDRTAR